MPRLVCVRFSLAVVVLIASWVLGRWILNGSIFAETPPAEKVADSTGDAELKNNPTLRCPLEWLLDPFNIPGSEAKTETEMKQYTEKIPGTDASFDMIPLPGGSFQMGSPESEENRSECEGPQRKVTIDPFWMGKCEVTWDEYELWCLGLDMQFRKITKAKNTQYDTLADAITMPTKPYSDMTFGMGKEGYPAICMTQLAAKVYCKWLSAKTGRYYRLPTEAEWEYACRAGTSSAYSFGDDPEQIDEYAWYYDNSDDQYHPVGNKKPNPWGLHDMHGNVAEWVLDQFIPEGYSRLMNEASEKPLLVPTTLYPRVVRGGSWADDQESLRSASRAGSDLSWNEQDPQIPQSIWYHTDASHVGFRVVRPLVKPAVEEAARYDIDQAQQEAMAEYAEARGGI